MTSSRNMEENGWNLENIKRTRRLALNDQSCMNRLDKIEKHKWMVTQWSTSSIATSFWDQGKATLEFGNCNNQGRVTVLLDGEVIANSTLNTESTIVAFNVAQGSTLTIQTDDLSIIRLFGMKLDCGKLMIFLNEI